MDSTYNYAPDNVVEVDIGGELRRRTRRAGSLELANGLEDDYNQQVADYDKYLMLYMLES